MKRTITERAALARINRHLAKEEAVAKRTRFGSRAEADLGRVYVVSLRTNTLEAWHCDAETLGKELGVIADWEQVEG